MDGGHSVPENAIRYFAVIGVHDEAVSPEAGDLPVQVLQRYPQKDHKDVRFPPAVASFCFPRGGAQVAAPADEVAETLHGFVLTNEAGDRCFGAALHIWCGHSSGTCLVQRALAVVSTQPLWGAFRAFLYSLRYSGNSPERLVVSFVSETPLPPPGFQVIVPWPEIPAFALQRPAPNQLPLLDLPVRSIFRQLKPESVVTMVEALLLEHRIVLHSTCMSALCAFGEILVGLIWPLRPAAVYVPLLPDALVDFCGAPLPFVLGISSYMVQRAEAICEPQTMFVDIDHGEIRAIQENCMSTSLGFCSTRPGEHRIVGPRPRPAAPDRPHKKLLRRLDLALRGIDFQAAEQKTRFPLPLSRPVPSSSALIRQRSSSFGGLATTPSHSSPSQGRPRMSSGVSDLSDGVALQDVAEPPWRTQGDHAAMTDNVHSPEHVLAKQGSSPPEGEQDSMIRRAFLWFMTDLLVDHSRFTNGKFDGGFDQTGFLAKCSETERPFLKELTSTQMWASWISRRLASGEDSKDIVLFDEVIAQKLNRKTFTLSKTATPFLSLDFSEKGHYREVRVPDPPGGSVAEPEDDRTGRGAPWCLEESRLYKPRPMEAMPVTTGVTTVERPGVIHAPLPAAPLLWYVQHCWLLTWAAYLPDRPEHTHLQWAKMDLCLGILHRMTPGDPRDQSSPPPHDAALSMLAAACARCGALRVDLAERLFTWMKARRLVAATHPQSLSVFFERFVQLCASDTSRHEGSKGPLQVSEVVRSPGELGPQSGAKTLHTAEPAVRTQTGASPRPTKDAGTLLFQDLKARPRVECAPKPTLPRLSFSLQCRFCSGKISLEDVDTQWSKPGSEVSSHFQCPHCRADPSTLKLRVETGSRDPMEIDLLHPKRLGLALRELDSLTGPEWLARLAKDFPHWHLNLLWHFRRFGLFDEHLLTALEPEKAHKGLTSDGTVVRSDTRSRLRSSSDTQSLSETLQCQAGTMNSVVSVQSNPSQGGTFEVWGDADTSWTREGSSRRNSVHVSQPHPSAGPEASEPMELMVERLKMEMEDLRSQLYRKAQARGRDNHKEAASTARKVLGRAYGKVLEELMTVTGPSSEEQHEAATAAARQVLGQTYGKVLDELCVFAHQQDRPVPQADADILKAVLQCVAGVAVAKAVTGALCRLLPTGSLSSPGSSCEGSKQQAPEPARLKDACLSRPAEQNEDDAETPNSPEQTVCPRESEPEKSTCWGSTSPGDESTDGTGQEILSSESGHLQGRRGPMDDASMGVLPGMEVPICWDANLSDGCKSGILDAGFGTSAEPVVLADTADDDASLATEAHRLWERLHRRQRIWDLRKLRRAWRVWRALPIEDACSGSFKTADGGDEHEEQEQARGVAEEISDSGDQQGPEPAPPDPDKEDELSPWDEHESQPSEVKHAGDAGPEDEAEVQIRAGALPDAESGRSSSPGLARPICPEPACVLQPDESQSRPDSTPSTPQQKDQDPQRGKDLPQTPADHADLEHDGGRVANGLAPIQKALAPPLVSCSDVDHWNTRRPRGHPHFQHSAFLTSARDPSTVLEPQPRRSASAPPERRKRGRRHKIVPRVISTGLATAPTSAVHSPNSVFPTPLLPKERSQASRALPPERGRDRRSRSVTAVAGVSSAW